MKSISIGEIPTFMKVDYLSPQDCIIQGYRTRRVPISSVLDLVNDHGEFELDAYHYGYSNNGGRHIRYSHVIRIDQERECQMRYSFGDLNSQIPALSFDKLYSALWCGPLNEQHANINMMVDIHDVLGQYVNENFNQLNVIEVDQFGNVVERFDLDTHENRQFNILEKELEYISWVELPIFSVHITELPPE